MLGGSLNFHYYIYTSHTYTTSLGPIVRVLFARMIISGYRYPKLLIRFPWVLDYQLKIVNLSSTESTDVSTTIVKSCKTTYIDDGLKKAT